MLALSNASKGLILALCAIGGAASSVHAQSQPGQAAPSSQAPIASPPISGGPTPGQISTLIPADPEKRDLELRKLRTEIDKLNADIDKAHVDAYTGWIAPGISALTIVVLVATLLSQRSTALKVQAKQRAQALEVHEKQSAAALELQKKQGDSALALQKRQGGDALELKIVELIMSSRSPALARGRAELLSRLYQGQVSSPFLKAVAEMTAKSEFPGDLGFELRTKVFEEISNKYDEPSEVALLARRIFSGDNWLKEDIVPPESKTDQA